MGEVVSLNRTRGRTPSGGRGRLPIRSISLAALLLLVLVYRDVYAVTTWRLIAQFDRTIGCAYFFDENHGLIGSGVRWEGFDLGSPCAIYKTTDGGVTWKTAQVPVVIYGAVTSIYMQDSLTGYASILPSVDYSVAGTFGGSSLWKTTDGGSTWFVPFRLDHAISSVYVQNGLMVITKWDWAEFSSWKLAPPDFLGGDCSYDGGLTWTPSFRWCNDVAFSDSLNGVITEMNQISPGNNFWFTTDAGRTWQQSASDQYESWSVFAVPNQHIYFCANESQYGLPHQAIHWSTDGGNTWSQRYYFPNIAFTGTITGVGNTLYIQTDTENYGVYFPPGLYRSDDLGASWHWIGGPSNSRDSRFAATGCQGQVVYAFDDSGGVWKTTDGGDGTLGPSITMNTDTIRWTPNPCGDTLRFNAYCGNCIPVTIDSAYIVLGTELKTVPEPGILPAALSQNDSVLLSLLYTPTKPGESASIVRVLGHSGERSLSREITIITETTQANFLSLPSDTGILSVTSCGSATDSIDIFNSGCPGLVIDSVTMPPGNVGLLTSLPLSVPDSSPAILQFLYQPLQTEHDTIMAHIYAHQGFRTFDTTIVLDLESSIAPPVFVLDSTRLSLSTHLCRSRFSALAFSALSCDSITIDSITSSNLAFAVGHFASNLATRDRDSVGILFQPDSAGVTSGLVHLYAHSRFKAFDTTIAVAGTNVAIPNSVVLSSANLRLAAAACQPVQDTFLLSNQGCDSLVLDSMIASDDSEMAIAYDTAQLPLAGGDTLPIRVTFNPSDGAAKVTTIRVYLHSASRVIDTVLTINSSNVIPANPLSLSSDSLYLFTKYCQPVSVPFIVANTGCHVMRLDSIALANDTLGEFSVVTSMPSITSNGSDTARVTFTPSIAGMRNAALRLYLSEGGKSVDTTMPLAGKNLTAPVPFIPILPPLGAGKILEIPIMLEPTSDTFSIRSFAFHLAFNTDLLTPEGFDFANTCSWDTIATSFIPEPGGCSGTVRIADTISDTSQLANPLVYVMVKVSLAKDTVTSIVLDSFVTDREPAMQLCSIPEQTFYLAPKCGDPLMLQLMNGESLSFDFISVAPNPASEGEWTVSYRVQGTPSALALGVYDVRGNEMSHTALDGSLGDHSATISVPGHAGIYILVLSNGRERKARTVTVLE